MSKPTPAKPAATGDQDPRIGVYVCHCGLNIAQSVDCHQVARDVADAEGVVISKDIVYACSEPGQQQIKQDIIDNNLDRVVIASCSPRLHEATFKKMIDSVGLNPYMLDMANLREQCSWVHMNDRDDATLKAETLVNMSISRARNLQPLHRGHPAPDPENAGHRRRHCRHPGGARPGRHRLRCHPGGEEPLHRRHHGPDRQDLSHHGLLYLNLRS